MAKLLFVTVGVGQNADIVSGIEYLIRRENPEKVIFIGSKESREKIYEPHLIGKELIKKCQPEWELLSDENDYRKIYDDCKQVIKRHQIQYPLDKNEYIADFTTGTKAMSAGLTLAAFAKEFQNLSYISGKRENGRVISGEEFQFTVPLRWVYLDRDLKKITELFNHYQFSAAAELTQAFFSYRQDREFQNKVNFLMKLIRGFSAWDRFDFKEANKIFTELTRDFSDFLRGLGLKNKLDQINQNLHRCSEDPYSDILAADLFENALRRIEEWKYDDAVARLYRLIEFLAQKILTLEFKIDSDDVNLSLIPESIRENARGILPESRNGKIQISMEKTFKLLELLKHPLGQRFLSDSEMKELQRKRNYSILAHGFYPVGKESCEKLRNLVESYLNPPMIQDFQKFRESCRFPNLELNSLEKLFEEKEEVGAL